MSGTNSVCPKGMVPDIIEKSFSGSEEKISVIWEKLNRRETFVKGQIFPYRVEFMGLKQEGPFEVGELNIHHGPLLSLHGAIGDIEANYRDLQYNYGSYVISFRWIRPLRLEFFRNDDSIQLKIHCYVSPWIKPFWRFSNDIFWKFFGITFLF